MNCETAYELMTQGVAGELTPAQQSALEHHLRQCVTCARRARELDRLSDDLHSLGDHLRSLDAPFVFDAAEQKPHGTQTIVLTKWLRNGVVAIAAVIALLLILVYRPDGTPQNKSRMVLNDAALSPAAATSVIPTPPLVVNWIDNNVALSAPAANGLRMPSFAPPRADGRAATMFIGTPRMTLGPSFGRLKHDGNLDDHKSDPDHGLVAPGNERSMGRVIDDRKPV